MTLTWTVLVDLLDGDGVPDDDLSAYWMGTDLTQGMRGEDQHIADTGRCTILLRNDDRRFTPNDAGGTYYGHLESGRAAVVKAAVSGGSAVEQFRGVVAVGGWQPAAGAIDGSFACHLHLVDALRQMQETDITLPLMEDIQPDFAIEHIVSAAAQAGVHAGTVYFMGPLSDGDTLTFADVTLEINLPSWGRLPTFTYTFRSALSGGGEPYEVLIETDPDGSDITTENLAAAINRDLGEATAYGTDTPRNPLFSATATPRVGTAAALRDGWVALRDTVSGYDALAQSLQVQTSTLTTERIWLYLRKVGSPTGTLTLTLGMNERGLPNGVQFGTVTATFDEDDVSADGGWVVFTLSDYVTLLRYQTYHIMLETDRAASPTDYIEWGDYSAGSGSAQQTGSTWTSMGNAFVWCSPGRLDVKALFRGASGSYRIASSNADAVNNGPVGVPTLSLTGGNTPSWVSLQEVDAEIHAIPVLGDQWRSSVQIDARSALADLTSITQGYVYVAEDGTITYRTRAWPFEAIANTPAVTLDNQQNDTQINWGRALVNRVVIEYTERVESADTVIARAGGSVLLPTDMNESAADYARDGGSTTYALGRGWRANPTEPMGPLTITLPFADDSRGIIVGATDVITPVPGTDYTLTTEPDGGGSNVTASFGTRRPGRPLHAVVMGGEVQVTFPINRAGHPVYVNNLQARGTALVTLHPQQIVVQDDDSIAQYGVKEVTIHLSAPSGLGIELAHSLAHYLVDRYKDERNVVESVEFWGQTAVGGASLYDVVMGDVVTIKETQTATVTLGMVIGRQIADTKRQGRPILSWRIRPIDDYPTWILGDSTYGVLPTRMSL